MLRTKIGQFVTACIREYVRVIGNSETAGEKQQLIIFYEDVE